jgi:hypothetical protein
MDGYQFEPASGMLSSALKMPWSAGILPAFGAHFHGFRVPVSRRA